MEAYGKPPALLEFGNAWALRDPAQPHTNSIVGATATIPSDSLRWLSQLPGDPAGAREQVCVKWFQHRPDDPAAWGYNKPLSEGRTLSILVSPGRFQYSFNGPQERFELCLEQPGDFVIWGPDLAHCWRVLEPCTVLTIRWRVRSTQNEEKSQG